VARIFLTYLGHCVEVPQGDSMIGRAVSCLLRFNDAGISRNHCRLRVHGSRITVTDLGSSNGTRVNGERIQATTELKHGDRIEVDHRTLSVVISAAEDHFEDSTVQYAEVPAPTTARADRCGRCGHRVEPGKHDHDCDQPWSDLQVAAVTEKIAVRATTQRDERRQHARHRVQVRVIYRSRLQTVEAVVTDLSRKGAFIAMIHRDAVGTECDLTLLADGAPAVTLQAWVVRAETESGEDRRNGVGIEFIHLRPAELRWLDDTIIRLGSPPHRT
jgi:hypothetical protein